MKKVKQTTFIKTFYFYYLVEVLWWITTKYKVPRLLFGRSAPELANEPEWKSALFSLWKARWRPPRCVSRVRHEGNISFAMLAI